MKHTSWGGGREWEWGSERKVRKTTINTICRYKLSSKQTNGENFPKTFAFHCCLLVLLLVLCGCLVCLDLLQPRPVPPRPTLYHLHLCLVAAPGNFVFRGKYFRQRSMCFPCIYGPWCLIRCHCVYLISVGCLCPRARRRQGETEREREHDAN